MLFMSTCTIFINKIYKFLFINDEMDDENMNEYYLKQLISTFYMDSFDSVWED